MPPKESKTPLAWSEESTYDYLLMLNSMFKPELGSHPTPKTYSKISNALAAKYDDDYDIESLKSKLHRMRKAYKAYLLVQSHTGLGWDDATQTVSCPEAVKKHFMENNKEAAKIIKKGLPNVELYEAIFATSTAIGRMAMASGGGRLFSDDSDQEPDDITMTTAPLSGEKRPCLSETTTRKAKKKGKSVAAGQKAKDNLISLMSRNQELKIAHKEAWFAKQKGIAETTSTVSDPYGPVACMEIVHGPVACMEIVQSLDLSIEHKVNAIDYVTGRSKPMQKCFVLMDPTVRVAWLMKHVS